MDDLFAKKKRRKPFLAFGAGLFGVLAAASIFDAVRDEPLIFAGEPVGSLVERLGYRIGAALVCILLAAFLFPRSRSEEREPLLK
ncbi:hypothetical protein AKJ08_0022 [Vulgatibacter incomptus]|uniref:Uncharacterized protein n=1 Tax=Vulgatibacter incomptus TaxID=1391653 RepID=A0A0K1P7Z0_9BACT|nr:hypothetical protein AKJ08_0022 [Vulgatibacter incomptus]